MPPAPSAAPATSKEPTHAGGVLYRWRGDHPEFLVVTAKNENDVWVFPKGHVEAQEDVEQAALREVEEESGFIGTIVEPLQELRIEVKGEQQCISFYLMECVAEGARQEQRRSRWLDGQRAIEQLTHRESRELLSRAMEAAGRERRRRREFGHPALFYGAALVALALALTYAVVVGDWMKATAVGNNLVEIGLQVLVFGLIGGLVKLWLDRANARRAFRREVLQRLGHGHREVYRVRRLLTLAPPAEHPALLGQLMDARQDLGGIFHDVRMTGLIQTRKRVQNLIQEMRIYLEQVIDGAREAPSGDGEKRKVYDDFVGLHRGGHYETHFKARYTLAKRLVDPHFEG